MPPARLNAEAQAHIEKARESYSLFERLSSEGEYPDWAGVLLFYTALHLVQAHAEQNSPHPPSTHQERRHYVAQRLGSIFREYAELQYASEIARYDVGSLTSDEVAGYHDVEFRKLRRALESRGVAI
jgi:hypothetical protein